MRLDDFVLRTLENLHVDQLNFKFGPMRVYPLGYRRDIAGCIRNGSIELRLGSASSAAGSFAVATPRGQIHPMVFSSTLVEERSGVLHLKDLSVREQADLRGTIIHESTHALQDWQRINLTPRMAEGAAYLAGAITRRLWGYHDLSPVTNPQVSGIAFSLNLADRFLAARVHSRYIISEDDIQVLCSLVHTGSANRYVFNGI